MSPWCRREMVQQWGFFWGFFTCIHPTSYHVFSWLSRTLQTYAAESSRVSKHGCAIHMQRWINWFETTANVNKWHFGRVAEWLEAGNSAGGSGKKRLWIRSGGTPYRRAYEADELHLVFSNGEPAGCRSLWSPQKALHDLFMNALSLSISLSLTFPLTRCYEKCSRNTHLLTREDCRRGANRQTMKVFCDVPIVIKLEMQSR